MTEINDIYICFACDNHYVPYMGIAMTSILINKLPQDKLHFYVLTSDISESNKRKLAQLEYRYASNIQYINVNKHEFTNYPIGAEHLHTSIATYYRFLLARLLPQDIDKVLYLDCDLIVTSSLHILYNISMTNKYIAGVIDVEFLAHSKRLGVNKYCNAGVLLVNLHKWRSDNIEKRLFDYMAEHQDRVMVGDQDVLNVVLQDGLIYLDETWNMHRLDSEFIKQNVIPNIRHYTGCMKPWVYRNMQPLAHLYHHYFALSPWADQILYFKFIGLIQFSVIIIRKIIKKIIRA